MRFLFFFSFRLFFFLLFFLFFYVFFFFFYIFFLLKTQNSVYRQEMYISVQTYTRRQILNFFQIKKPVGFEYKMFTHI